MSPVAVVTGAARGLGYEIARRLHGRGHHVHLVDVDEVGVEAAAGGLGAAGVSSGALDVRDEAACRRVASEVVATHGSLDVWVNNAGVLYPGPAWEQPEAVRTRTLEVNAGGVINGTVAALEQMRPVGRGKVLNIASMAGLAPAPGIAVYSASKHAVVAFSVATQADLKSSGLRGITISALCPSGIWTPMLHDKTDDPWARTAFSQGLLDPGQVADAAMSLLDHPRPVRVVPRRGAFAVRLGAAAPRLGIALVPVMERTGRWMQRRAEKRGS
jgi:NAD(P)-dependent dehydrogenase (short-subunit alcohol dehydrogenase family)